MLAKRWAAGAGGAAQRPAPIAGVARYCMACLCLHGWARTARSQRELERAARAAFVYLPYSGVHGSTTRVELATY